MDGRSAGKFVRMEEEAMRVTDHPILGEMKDVRTVTFYYNGQPMEGIEGEPVAAALMNAGIRVFRTTAKRREPRGDRKSTRLNSSHVSISYAVFCLKSCPPGRLFSSITSTSAPARAA